MKWFVVNPCCTDRLISSFETSDNAHKYARDYLGLSCYSVRDEEYIASFPMKPVKPDMAEIEVTFPTPDTRLDCINGCFRFWIGSKLDSTYYHPGNRWIVDFGHEQLFSFGSEVEARFAAIAGEATTRAIMKCSAS